jgi:UDP-glucose 4-epimerase
MKKILVTGGFGFIGSTLVEILVKKSENKIHVIDDMSTSPIDIEDYLVNIGKPKNLTYEITAIEKFFQGKEIGYWDEIYHLASPVGPAGVLKHAGKMIQTVVRDGYLIINYCLKNKTRFLDVSTSEIYGGGQNGYCSENMPKIIPAETNARLEYAIAKLAVETAAINSCRNRGLDAVIVRPFNVAGKRQSPKGGFAVPRFIQQAYQNQPLTVFGDGSAVRAFTHVEDMAKGIMLAMEKGECGEIYNLGNQDNKLTILELAKSIKKIMKSKSEIIFVDPKKIYGNYYEDANDKYPDAKKAIYNLGWVPTLGTESVIKSARDEYLRQIKKGVLRDRI